MMQQNTDSEPRSQSENIPQQGYFVPMPATNNEDEISLVDIWRVLAKYKWLIFLIMSLSALISVIYALNATPVYRAEVIMIPSSDLKKGGGLSTLSDQLGGLASIVGVQLNKQTDISTATKLAILKSREFTEYFIREKELLSVLFEESWDSENKKWNIKGGQKPPSLWKAYEVFNGLRSVKEDLKTGLILLTIDWKDPNLAATWANELIDLLNKRQKEKALEDSKLNLEYLNKQREKTSVVAMQQSLFILIESEMKNAMLANSSDEYAFHIIDHAVAPEVRIWPKRTRIVLIALFMGFILSVILAFIMNMFHKEK